MKAELKRFGITQGEVAEFLGMTPNNFGLKINEKIPMTVDEARRINARFLPTVKLDYLLQSDGDTPTQAEAFHAQVDAMGDAMRAAVGGDDPEVDGIVDTFHAAVGKWAEADECKTVA